MSNPRYKVGDRVYDRLRRVEGTVNSVANHEEHRFLYKHTGHEFDQWTREDALSPSGCLVGLEIEHDG